MPRFLTCRLIRLISHTLKIVERTVYKRLREIVIITPDQCVFMSLTDVTQAVRLLAEKRSVKQKTILAVIIDFGKVFKRFSTELPSCLELICPDPKNTSDASSMWLENFPVRAGLHQGFIFFTRLFTAVKDSL